MCINNILFLCRNIFFIKYALIIKSWPSNKAIQYLDIITFKKLVIVKNSMPSRGQITCNKWPHTHIKVPGLQPRSSSAMFYSLRSILESWNKKDIELSLLLDKYRLYCSKTTMRRQGVYQSWHRICKGSFLPQIDTDNSISYYN